ncbi:AI-2E family transporter [Desulforegula conservatrix]|uniref:AI-2E family transporter n=1 Tax=Desulforegula conservatrix TaxID=153026 RepID=UPI00041151B7|nr:AI-2E family transporter [Desulforegula conservatrix]
MKMKYEPDLEMENRLFQKLMDSFIRVGLLFALVVLCYRIFSPFLNLIIWSLILAVTFYPLHQKIAEKIRGKQGLAATLVVVAGIILIVVPTAILASSLGDSIQILLANMKNNTSQIPEPAEAIKAVPLIGSKIYDFWTKAYTDLPALIQSMQPKVGNIAKEALSVVAGIGGVILKFMFSFIIAGIIMAYGKSGAETAKAISRRFVGIEKGDLFAKLSTDTIRSVALGVIGVACIQAIIVGLVFIFAGIPWTGVLSMIVLVLGIVQVPAAIVTLPAVAYIWISDGYGTGAAVVYTVLIIVGSMADNVLKPIMLGRGVDAPMPVILLGALGGMASAGILGMFIGAIFLALGYQIFMGWVKDVPVEDSEESIEKSLAAD